MTGAIRWLASVSSESIDRKLPAIKAERLDHPVWTPDGPLEPGQRDSDDWPILHGNMKQSLGYLFLLSCCLPSVAAEDAPARGKLLVATELVGGPVFAETVVLILQHNESGTLGLIVNRPTELTAEEVLPEFDQAEDYDGSLFFGGPVRLYTIRALIRTDSPPAGAVNVFAGVHIAALGDEPPLQNSSPQNTRYYLGYAGWGAGQLDRELAEGSWRIVAATEDIVFNDDAAGTWRKLAPQELLRVAL